VKIINEKHGIKFRIIQPDDFEQTVDLCSQVFANYEPMTKSFKINYKEFKTLAEPYCRKAIEDGLSIVATDSNGKVVGFVISEDLMTEPPFLDEISDKFEPILTLLHELDSSYTSKNSFESGQILHIFLLGVQDEYKNHKIATTLVQENLKLAKSHDFSTSIAEATGLTSQHIFRKLGFREEVTFFYDSYTFQGEKIFSSIKESAGCILMSYSIL